MRKRIILLAVSALLVLVGTLLMGVEILDWMNPDRLRLYAYLTSLGVAGMFIALLLKLREREERKKGK